MVVISTAPDERHGTGFQPPAVRGAQVGVAVVADAHVVLGMLDEAQRLGAAGLIGALDQIDERGAGHEQTLGRGVDEHGEAVERVGVAERTVGAVRRENTDQSVDVTLGDGDRVLGQQLLDLDEILGPCWRHS